MKSARLLRYFLILGFVLGLFYRFFPLFAGPDALARFFVTEDGYLMLTIARNIAIGNGFSVSAGEIATNGVQPLATLLFAVPYVLTGGAKLSSLVGVHLIMILASVGTVGAIAIFARSILATQTANSVGAWLVGVLWFVGPLSLMHSMNALETGLYVGTVAATMAFFGHLMAKDQRYTIRDQTILGLLCGLIFLVRNDGAFLVMALFLVRFLHVQIAGRLNLRDAVLEALPPGLISLVIAAPWLVYNKINFDSIVPISGLAQSLGAEFGQNLPLVSIKVFETMFPMLPVPAGLETSPALSVLAAAITLLVLGFFFWRVLQRGGPVVAVVAAYLLYGVMLIGYYGLFFGAPHFLSRYFAPLAPLLIAAAVSVAQDLARRSPWQDFAPVSLAGIAGLALSLGLLIRPLLPDKYNNGHFQVVEWIEKNVTEQTWVGAIQTGTLGYWHDRTINLDGKVNPAALQARREQGNVLAYVAASPIDYLADWVGIASWANISASGFDAKFELIIDDPQRNLAVLRRRSDGG